MQVDRVRLSGLSGFDSESMIDKLMAAERKPLENLKQNKQLLEWKRDNYRDVNSLLLELKNMANDMRYAATYRKKTVSSTNSTALTAIASSNATNGAHQVNVQQLASSARAISTTINYTDPTNKTVTSTDRSFTLNGIQIDLTAGDTITNLVDKINAKKSDTKVQVSYDQNLDKLFFSSTNQGAAASINFGGTDSTWFQSTLGLTSSNLVSAQISSPFSANDSFFVNGQAITVNSGETLDDVINRINTFTGTTGVRATNDNNKMVLTSLNNDNIMINEAPSSTFVQNTLQLAVNAHGTDAVVKYDGTYYNFNSNDVSIDGLSLSLKSAMTGDINLTISQDTEGMFNSIVKFIDKYNEIIDKVNGKLSEEKKKGIKPLTDDEREKMSASQIELWEKNAKSGILRHDTIIQSGLTQMREDFSTAVTGLPESMNTMFDLGLETGKYQTKGKITYDPDKVKQKLISDPEGVINLFTKLGVEDPGVPGSKQASSGIAERLYHSLDDVFQNIIKTAGDTNNDGKDFISGQLKDLDNKIDDFERKLTTKEDNYWKKFTAMEKAMSQANAQSGWLMQQFGGGQ